MSATAASHVKEATLTWLDERGYAIPARLAAPGDRELPSAGFAIHSQLTSPPNLADKATRLDIYTPLLVTVKVRDVDRYGRLVADAILSNGLNLGHELMQAGMAWWYRSTPATMQPWQGSKPRRRPRSVGCGVIRMPWRRGRGARSGGAETGAPAVCCLSPQRLLQPSRFTAVLAAPGREALGRRTALRVIELSDILQPQADDGLIPCLHRLLRRVVQAKDPVVTADAEGGPVSADAAHGVHSPVALGLN